MNKKLFYYSNCYKCRSSVKVTIEAYRSKTKVYCNSCLDKTFKKIKKN